MGNSSSKKQPQDYNHKRDSITGAGDIEAFRQQQLELQRKYQEEQRKKEQENKKSETAASS